MSTVVERLEMHARIFWAHQGRAGPWPMAAMSNNSCAEPGAMSQLQLCQGLVTNFLHVESEDFATGISFVEKNKIQKSPVALALWMMGREQWENPRETSTFFSLSLLLIFTVEWKEDWRKVEMMNWWEKEGHCSHWAAASHKCILNGKTKNPFQVMPAVNLTSISYFYIIFFLFFY